MANKETPYYIAPPTGSLVTQYENLFNSFEVENKDTLILEMSEDLVEKGSVSGILDLLKALQHKPHLIEKMLFAFKINFVEKGTRLPFPESYWKNESQYCRWFHKLFQAPLAMFFLEDEDCRFYTLIGDLIADDKLEIKDDGEKKKLVCLSGESLQITMHRLFDACWWLLVFCHGSGFNPQIYIEATLADMDLPLTYEEVYEAFIKDKESGQFSSFY
ncbi:MAG: hypothetical protein ACTHK0_07550 [Ginsengibacter sp.]